MKILISGICGFVGAALAKALAAALAVFALLALQRMAQSPLSPDLQQPMDTTFHIPRASAPSPAATHDRDTTPEGYYEAPFLSVKTDESNEGGAAWK